MGKIVARNAKILTDGYDLSGNFNNSKLTQSAEAPDVTCYGDSNRVRLGGGIQDQELSIDGFYNWSPSSVDEVFSNLFGASCLVSFLPSGYAASQVAYGLPAVLTKYDLTFALANAAAVSLTFSSSANGFHGKSLGLVSANAGSQIAACNVDFGAGAQSETYALIHVLGGTATSISASLVSGSAPDAVSDVTTELGEFTNTGKAALVVVSGARRYRQVRYAFAGGTGQIVVTCGG